MNFEADDLLEMVDRWKFKLHEKLQKMTPKERAAFWKEAHEQARAAGYRVIDVEEPAKAKRKRRKRSVG